MGQHTNCSDTVGLGWLKIQQGWSGHKPKYKSVMVLKECPPVQHTNTQTHIQIQQSWWGHKKKE